MVWSVSLTFFYSKVNFITYTSIINSNVKTFKIHVEYIGQRKAIFD